MSRPGRIRYAGFATLRHSGGVHVQTQHVSLLRAAGYDAAIWLPDPDVRPTWFDLDVPMVFGPQLEVGADDLLVLPETPVVPGVDPAPGARTVLFNQNHFYTFAGFPIGSTAPYPGWSPEAAVWTVSTEARAVLQALLPATDVRLVPNHVDPSLFRAGPRPRPAVAWFAKKRPREAAVLGRLLATDPRFADVDLLPIVDLTRAEVAATLGRATVFLSLSHTDGFGLPVAEAMASQCLVVGYDGGGGHELFAAPGAWAVPEQRPLLLLDAAARALGAPADLGAANRAWVLARYGVEQTRDALLAAVEAAFAGPGAPAVATHPLTWINALGPNFTAYA